MKECKNCKQLLPLSAYHKAKDKKHGVESLCKSCRKEKAAEMYKENWFHLTTQLKKSFCKSQNIPFDLDAEYLASIWTDTCPVYDVKFVKHDKLHPHSPALDRLDPSKGYVKGNVVYISARANRIKYDATVAELRQLADWFEGATTRS